MKFAGVLLAIVFCAHEGHATGLHAQQIANGAVHAYQLNETSGTVATDTGSSPSDGTYSNASTLSNSYASAPAYTASCFSSRPCMAFSGSQILVARSLGTIEAVPYTGACYVERTGGTGNYSAACFGSNNTAGFLGFANSANTAFWQTVGGGGQSVSKAAADSAGHSLVGTVSSGTLNLYVDGGTAASASVTTGNLTTDFGIGNDPDASFPFTGNASEVVLFNTALNSTNAGTLATNQTNYWGSGGSNTTKPCDAVGGCSHAWGMRVLVGGYAGFLARLQRASDNAISDIGADGSGNFDTTTAATFCASTTCHVIAIYDQTGAALIGVTLNSRPPAAWDVTSDALLNGSTGYVDLGFKDPPQAVSDGSFSIEFVSRLHSFPGSGCGRLLANAQDSDAKGVQMVTGGSGCGGNVANAVFTGGMATVPGSATYAVGTTYLTDFVYNGTAHTLTMYFNGASIGSVSTSGTYVPAALDINIARNPSSNADYTNPDISDVAFYNFALSSGQVTADYNAFNTCTTTICVDNYNNNNGGQRNSHSTTITNRVAGELVLLFVDVHQPTSITDSASALSFALRGSYTTAFPNVYVYRALAATALNADSITVNTASSSDQWNMAILTFAPSGLGFDPNVSLPAFAGNTNNPTENISTTDATTLLMVETSTNGSFPPGCDPTGFSSLGLSTANFSQQGMLLDYQPVSSAQSGKTITPGCTYGSTSTIYADAVGIAVGGATGNLFHTPW